MNLDFTLRYYHKAKSKVYNDGFFYETYWQEKANPEEVTVQKFLSEYSWVVLSSGMKESIVSKKFDKVSEAFKNWEDLQYVVQNKAMVCISAQRNFNHIGKIEAIAFMCELLYNNKLNTLLESIKLYGVKYLEEFPFMGPATSMHFAKNLGYDIAKPDRHLNRISAMLGFSCPNVLCQKISDITGDKSSVVDIILWRYATIDSNYLTNQI